MTTTQTESVTRGYSPEPVGFEIVSLNTALNNTYSAVFDTTNMTQNGNLKLWPETKMLTITNTNSNYALKYTVYGSNETSPETYDWVTLIGDDGRRGEQTILHETSDYQTTGLPWVHLKVECKNSVSEQVASVRIRLRTVLRNS